MNAEENQAGVPDVAECLDVADVWLASSERGSTAASLADRHQEHPAYAEPKPGGQHGRYSGSPV